MKRALALPLSIMFAGLLASAQDKPVRLDEERHYSRVFDNEYCRAYMVNLGRLEETKPVVHEHDWVRMTLAGAAEQAWGGTVFSSRGSEDAQPYIISFLYPVDRLTLRNPRSVPYQAVIVEIMQSDDSRNRRYDPSLDHVAQQLGPGVDPHASYITFLTKTSVQILHVQLVADDSKEIKSNGVGALLVAMTDVNLRRTLRNAAASDIQLRPGEVKWLPEKEASTLKNVGRDAARFVVLDMKSGQ